MRFCDRSKTWHTRIAIRNTFTVKVFDMYPMNPKPDVAYVPEIDLLKSPYLVRVGHNLST